MIAAGIVSDELEAGFSLAVISAGGHSIAVTAVIDTGFNGYLTLPADTIAALELPFHSIAEAQLDDGQTVALRKFEAHILWSHRERAVTVLETQGTALVGMAFLNRHRVIIDVIAGGAVTIDTIDDVGR